MPGTCVIGLQWGDEAKGKIVDLLTPKYDFVVRFLGGANAGHTVVHGENVFKLHHIPSGILNPSVVNIIAGGVVVNPPTILEEIDGLLARGIDLSNFILSDRCARRLPLAYRRRPSAEQEHHIRRGYWHDLARDWPLLS